LLLEHGGDDDDDADDGGEQVLLSNAGLRPLAPRLVAGGVCSVGELCEEVARMSDDDLRGTTSSTTTSEGGGGLFNLTGPGEVAALRAACDMAQGSSVGQADVELRSFLAKVRAGFGWLVFSFGDCNKKKTR
jgi:hypothetical protein